jgi:hypothetical protein
MYSKKKVFTTEITVDTEKGFAKAPSVFSVPSVVVITYQLVAFVAALCDTFDTRP